MILSTSVSIYDLTIGFDLSEQDPSRSLSQAVNFKPRLISVQALQLDAPVFVPILVSTANLKSLSLNSNARKPNLYVRNE